MKGVVIALGHLRGRAVAARLIDGRLEDLLVALPEGVLAPGAILRARVGRQIKGMGGVFLDLPGGQSGFLRQAKGLRPGQALLVQVTGVAEPGKAVPVTPRLTIKGRYGIVTPGAPGINVSRQVGDATESARLESIGAAVMEGADPELGLILRSGAEGMPAEALHADLPPLRALAEALLADRDGPPERLLDAPDPHEAAWRDWTTPTPDAVAEGGSALADHGVPDAIDALLASRVALPGGAAMVVEPTAAFVAVDVNTAEGTAAAGLKASIAAARELPRQLRLRGLGGQVIVDFAPLPRKDRATLDQVLRAAFRRDGAAATLAGWTPLGNFELQRRRDSIPLAQALGAVAS